MVRLCGSARGELLERNDHRLRGAVHLDGSPRHPLLRRSDDRAADLLVDSDSLEPDRLAQGHVEGGQENREGRAAGIDLVTSRATVTRLPRSVGSV